VTSLPEVVGDAAITVSPDDEEGFASAIVQVLSSPDLARTLREKGFMQAKQFNWSTVLQQMHTLYEHVL
jgi:glycosyltransferase involved in cell wall biosynthesis